MSKVIDYVVAADRNNPDAVRAHLYARTKVGRYWPMCEHGWNRSGGHRFSILRGNGSAKGVCKTCERRAVQRALPVVSPRGHKTKWI